MRRAAIFAILFVVIAGACTSPFAGPQASARATCAPVSLPSATPSGTPAASGVTVSVSLTISGIVRSAASCAAVESVSVLAYEAHLGAITISPLGGATTDASGLFELQVPRGTYRVLFIPPDDSALASRWWTNQPSYVRATPINVDHIGIDVLLPHGVSITGTVLSDSGAPQPAGVRATRALSDEYDFVTAASTDRSGHYTLMVLPGEYRLQFSALPPWAGQWWEKRNSYAQSDNIAVAQDIKDVSIMLHTGSTLSGRLTSPDASPLRGALAFAARPTTTGWCCEFVSNIKTDADGRYSLAVPDGTYRVGFLFTLPNGHFVAFWWPGGGTLEEAGNVIVNGARTDVDLQLPE